MLGSKQGGYMPINKQFAGKGSSRGFQNEQPVPQKVESPNNFLMLDIDKKPMEIANFSLLATPSDSVELGILLFVPRLVKYGLHPFWRTDILLPSTAREAIRSFNITTKLQNPGYKIPGNLNPGLTLWADVPDDCNKKVAIIFRHSKILIFFLELKKEYKLFSRKEDSSWIQVASMEIEDELIIQYILEALFCQNECFWRRPLSIADTLSAIEEEGKIKKLILCGEEFTLPSQGQKVNMPNKWLEFQMLGQAKTWYQKKTSIR